MERIGWEQLFKLDFSKFGVEFDKEQTLQNVFHLDLESLDLNKIQTSYLDTYKAFDVEESQNQDAPVYCAEKDLNPEQSSAVNTIKAAHAAEKVNEDIDRYLLYEREILLFFDQVLYQMDDVFANYVNTNLLTQQVIFDSKLYAVYLVKYLIHRASELRDNLETFIHQRGNFSEGAIQTYKSSHNHAKV